MFMSTNYFSTFFKYICHKQLCQYDISIRHFEMYYVTNNYDIQVFYSVAQSIDQNYLGHKFIEQFEIRSLVV